MRKNVISIVASLGFVMAFQNCSEVAFENSNPQLVTKIDSSDEDLILNEQVEIDLNDLTDKDEIPKDDKILPNDKNPNHPEQLTPIYANPIEPIKPAPNHNGDDEELPIDEIDDGGNNKSLVYTCIVAGHNGNGESLKISLINGNLESDKSTPETVCMSVHACLEIISQRFEIKGAKKQGYCGKNKNTVQLTDEQIKTLISTIQ